MKIVKTAPYIPGKIEVKELENNKAQVIAYPFETGFAITIAHPLRRLLLSSVVGYAPIAIKIEGATHEFDSIRGMLEDITLFILNLKNIRFKFNDSSETEVVVNYKFDGSKIKEILGSDLSCDELEVVTPKNHLATINSDLTLEFSLILKKGIGYVPSEDIRDKLPEGYIALDAFFTPINKAVYSIENVLVEDNPNFEKIIFDIETDGSITPKDAFKNALEVFNEQLSIFNKIAGVEISTVDTQDPVEEFENLKPLLQSIDNLDFSVRSFNSLDRDGIKYVAEISLMRMKDLRLVKNLGEKSIVEIQQTTESIGFPVGYEFTEQEIKYLTSKIEKLKN